MLGGFAQALMFLMTLALTVIVGSYGLAYLASCLLIIIEQSAAGNDEISWPDEPFLDRIWRVVQLVWLTAVWVAPAGLFVRVVAHYAAPEQAGILFVVAAGVALWLFFPVGVLSSLSAESPWAVLRPAILAGMLRQFSTTLGFYVVSFVLVGGPLALVVVTCATGQMWLVPVAGIMAATFVLIYGRLLGRLGWVVAADVSTRQAKLAKKESKPEKKPRPARAKAKARRVRRPKAETLDPWAAPQEPEQPEQPKQPSRTPWGGIAEPVEGYGLAKEAPPPEEKREARKNLLPEEDTSPIEMTEEEEAPPPEGNEPLPPVAEPDERELNRIQVSPPPAHPMLQGVYNFPWYRANVVRWIWLCVILSAIILLVQVMIILGSALT